MMLNTSGDLGDIISNINSQRFILPSLHDFRHFTTCHIYDYEWNVDNEIIFRSKTAVDIQTP